MPLPIGSQGIRSLLKKDEKRLRGYLGDYQEGAGRHSQHDERPEMMILRLPAQWTFFFYGCAGSFYDYRNC
jgi:hypothetical protein